MMTRDIGSGNGTDVAEKTKGLGASYTMGSAAVRLLLSDGDNIAGVDGVDNEHMEVSLLLAF